MKPPSDNEGSDTVLLRQFLDQRDAACPACAYDLRGLTSDRCPECAEPLVLQVGLRESRLSLFLAGSMGLAFGTGFSLLLLAYATWLWLRGRWVGGPVEFVVVTGAGVVVEGALLAIWLGYGRRFRRAKSGWRWLLVAACWFVTLANLAVFVSQVR